MSDKPIEELSPEEIAALLRKPEGQHGIQLADLMNKGNGPMNRHTLAVVNPAPEDHILEIGMGNGFLSPIITGWAKDVNYTGWDYAPTMVELATKLFSESGESGKIQFELKNIEEVEEVQPHFHKIFTVNTLYFWSNPQEVLLNIYQLLLPGGSFILSIRPKEIMDIIPVTEYNFKKYSESQVVEMLLTAGFENIEMTRIMEPAETHWGDSQPRACIIFKAVKRNREEVTFI